MDTEKKGIWEEALTIKSYDVDCTGMLKLGTLFNFFQESAGNHAAHLITGYQGLKELGYFWVLSRAKVRIRTMPSWGATVTLKTWPKGNDGLLFLRDFRMSDRGQETLLEGSTGWLLLDIEHNRPQSADALPVRLPENPGGHALEEPLKKLKALEELLPVYDRKVMVGDLDVNNHVNNAKYVEWIMDCFDDRHLASKTLRTFQVNYVGEAMLGDDIRLFRGEQAASPGLHYIEGIDRTKGLKVVQSQLQWE